MGQSLSALLVHDRKLAFRQVDSAVQRQRREGGGLDTCLLELGLVEPGALHEYLSVVSGLPAVEDAMLAKMERAASRTIPIEVAQASGIVPLRVRSGRLQCAVVEVPPPSVIASLESEHAASLELFVAPEFRWRALFGAVYGTALDPRFEELNRRYPAPIGFAALSTESRSTTTSAAFRSTPTDDGAFGSRNWSLDELTDYFARSASRDDVLRAALGFIGNVIARRMVVVPTHDQVRVFDSAGYGEAHSRLTGRAVPVPGLSMLERVVGESTYYFGPSDPAGVANIFALADLDVPHDIALVPVRVGRRTALVLLGDNASDAVDPRLIPLLFVVAGRLGQTLEAMIRRRKEERASGDHAHVAPVATAEARAAAKELNSRVISKLLAMGEPVAAGVGQLPDDGWDLPPTFTSARVLPEPPQSPPQPPSPPSSSTQPRITQTLPGTSAANPNTTQIIEAAANAARDAVAISQPTPTGPPLLMLELEPVDTPEPVTPRVFADVPVGPRASFAPLTPPGAPRGPDDAQLRRELPSLAPPALVELLSSNAPGVPESAQYELFHRGHSAHAALLSAFPGPILLGGTGATALETPVEFQGLLLHLAVLQSDELHPQLAGLAAHGGPLQRFYALAVLSRAQQPSATHLAAQQVLDADDALRALCLRIVDQSRDPSARTHAERLVLAALGASADRTVEHAINACQLLRLASSVPHLIGLLDGRSPGIVDRAHSALVRLTLRDAGRTTRRWKTWFARHTTPDRNLWLLEAMVDPDRKVRENAHRELRQMALSGINYTPDLDARALQTAQRAVARKLGVTPGS